MEFHAAAYVLSFEHPQYTHTSKHRCAHRHAYPRMHTCKDERPVMQSCLPPLVPNLRADGHHPCAPVVGGVCGARSGGQPHCLRPSQFSHHRYAGAAHWHASSVYDLLTVLNRRRMMQHSACSMHVFPHVPLMSLHLVEPSMWD